MSNVLTDIGLLASQNQFLAYFIIYIATIFLGNISAFASFWIVFRGFFGPWGVPFLMLTIFLADFSGDILWYSLGRATRDTHFGNFVKNHLPRHEKIEASLQKNSRNWVFLSKFIYASAFPMIFCVGWSRIDFKKFVRMSLLSVVAWLPVLTALAYGLVSGFSPLGAISVFNRFEVVFIAAIATFVAAHYLLAKVFKKILGGGLD